MTRTRTRLVVTIAGSLLLLPAAGAARADAAPAQLKARPFVTISGTDFLEGPSFDATGSTLYLAGGERVYRVRMRTRKARTLFARPGQRMASTAVGPDGRLYVADLRAQPGDAPSTGGSIFEIARDGTDRRVAVQAPAGEFYVPDDMVFDRAGNLFWSDLQGSPVQPTGRVMRTSADFASTQTVTSGFAWPNGIDFAPDGRSLWVADYLANRLMHLSIGADGLLERAPYPGGSISVAARFEGLTGPDSLRVDRAGNVYVAHSGSGRIVVLDPEGSHIATVRLPSAFKKVSNLAIRPGTRQAYATAYNEQGSRVFRFRALAAAASRG